MKVSDADVRGLEALSNADRLELPRLVAEAGAVGLPSGEIARCAGLGAGLCSHHLSRLAGAGLVHSRRTGRSVFYRADRPAMHGFVDRFRRALLGEDRTPVTVGRDPFEFDPAFR